MFTVDRIENGVAICIEDETMKKIEIKVSDLPEGIKQRDKFYILDDKFILDNEEREQSINRIDIIRKKLWINSKQKGI